MAVSCYFEDCESEEEKRKSKKKKKKEDAVVGCCGMCENPHFIIIGTYNRIFYILFQMEGICSIFHQSINLRKRSSEMLLADEIILPGMPSPKIRQRVWQLVSNQSYPLNSFGGSKIFAREPDNVSLGYFFFNDDGRWLANNFAVAGMSNGKTSRSLSWYE